MADVDTQAVPESDDSAQSAALERENERLRKEVAAVKANREKALDETKRLKRMKKLFDAVGVDIDAEDAEASLVSRVMADRGAVAPAKPDPVADTKTEDAGEQLADLRYKQLERQIKQLQENEERVKRERDEEIAKNRKQKIEHQVIDALSKAGATNPVHALRLMSTDDKYAVSLSEEGRVVGGPDYDPTPLVDVISAMRDDDSFSYLFRASGMNGSGAGSASNGAATTVSSRNPFMEGPTFNATLAANMLKSDPDKAKRYMGEARAAGKLPIVFQSLTS